MNKLSTIKAKTYQITIIKRQKTVNLSGRRHTLTQIDIHFTR